MNQLDPEHDYPLGKNRPDLIRTPSGAMLDDIGLEELRAGVIAGEDVRATGETLRLQADIAHGAGRAQLAENLRRAAELTMVPDDVILAVYTAMRPGRSTSDGLEDWARLLEDDFDAPTVAAFVREAAAVYADRHILR